MLPRQTAQPNLIKNNLRRRRKTDTSLHYKIHKLQWNKFLFSLFSGKRESQAQVFQWKKTVKTIVSVQKRTTGMVMNSPWGLCRQQNDCACVRGLVWSQLHKNAYPSHWRPRAEIGDSEGLRLKDICTIKLLNCVINIYKIINRRSTEYHHNKFVGRLKKKKI